MNELLKDINFFNSSKLNDCFKELLHEVYRKPNPPQFVMKALDGKDLKPLRFLVNKLAFNSTDDINIDNTNIYYNYKF